jgi:hypothetical protein
MRLPTSQFRLSAVGGETESAIKEARIRACLKRYKCLRLVDQVYNAKGWMIIFFHNVVPNPSPPFEISTKDFSDFLDYLILKGVKTITVNQALDDLGVSL